MNKTYAVSDLHGQGQLWKQIKEYIDETDTLYYLGDAIDRGPDGINIMLDLLKMPNVIYLKGNHEEFFTERALNCFCGHNDNLWMLSNGGDETVLSMRHKWDDTNPCDENYISKLTKKIGSLPYKAEYKNKNDQTILLSHSGYYAKIDNDALENEYLWNRDHFYNTWAFDENTFIVHGHTPCCNLISKIYNSNIFYAKTQEERNTLLKEGQEILTKWSKQPSIFKYTDGHKIDLDLGSFQTKKIALFDLDKLEVEKYFTGE